MRPSCSWICRQTYAGDFQKLCRLSKVCPGPARFLSTSRQRHTDRNDDPVDEPTINYFEQEFVPTQNGTKFKTIGLPENIQAHIQRLESELQELREQTLRDLGADLDDNAARRGAEAVIGAMGSDSRVGTSIDSSDDSPEVELRLPDRQASSLQRLNRHLRAAASGKDGVAGSRSLWNAYTSSKREVPGLLEQLPKSAWCVLWASQYESPLLNDARSKHLWTLTKDLISAGQHLTPVQRMVQLESLCASEQYEKAAALWKEGRPQLGQNREIAEAFWALGTKISIALGEWEKALELSLQTAAEFPTFAISSFIPVIEGCLRSQKEGNTQQAAAIYFRLRVAIGESVTLEDLDRIVLCFLQNGASDLALGVFRDMVLMTARSSQEVGSLHQRSQVLFQRFQSGSGNDMEETNRMALRMLEHLPKRMQNKYFYASWLKRLIGLDELEAAHKVLELMYHRGVRPDAKHLNGLMSAWLRRGNPHSRSLAIELGKAMVQARLNFVASRRGTLQGSPPPPGLADFSASLPPYLGRALPPATIETFSILLLHYERSNMTASMSQLQSTLHMAELEPNIFFINHILHSHLRAGDPGAAWKLYNTTVSNRLRADIKTFVILWSICKVHVEMHAPGRAQAFPTPRSLFGHMSRWFATMSASEMTEAQTTFDGDFYTQIIRCFCLARDLHGALIALYALRDYFSAYPDVRAVRLIALLVAQLSEPVTSTRVLLSDGSPGRRRRSVRARAQANQARLDRVLHLLENMRAERAAAPTQSKGATDAIQEKGEEELRLLGKLLHDTIHLYALNSTVSSTEIAASKDEDYAPVVVDTHLDQIAFEMGANEVRVGELALGEAEGNLQKNFSSHALSTA